MWFLRALLLETERNLHVSVNKRFFERFAYHLFPRKNALEVKITAWPVADFLNKIRDQLVFRVNGYLALTKCLDNWMGQFTGWSLTGSDVERERHSGDLNAELRGGHQEHHKPGPRKCRRFHSAYDKTAARELGEDQRKEESNRQRCVSGKVR